ncbi:hypothetical protein [Niabella hirudinis]|uniref:hypothetical protein n=1 Tax=Niabella hirudinis TaxID=1285929 RepID=UPI003EBA9214
MKFTPQILRTKPPTGPAFNFFLDPRAKKFYGVRWHAKKCVCALQAFNPHFSVLALTTFFICPFALMQKNEKIKAKSVHVLYIISGCISCRMFICIIRVYI